MASMHAFQLSAELPVSRMRHTQQHLPNTTITVEQQLPSLSDASRVDSEFGKSDYLLCDSKYSIKEALTYHEKSQLLY
jgi:hypothetical protein